MVVTRMGYRAKNNQNQPVTFTLDGRAYRGFAGETIAEAIIASDDIGGHKESLVWGRSTKYHRPRSYFCLSGHCGSCLMRVDGVPNIPICQTLCHNGQMVHRQNALPSASRATSSVDILEAADWIFRGKLDHHTLGTQNRLFNKVTTTVVRRLAGIGHPPDPTTPIPLTKKRTYSAEVCIIGGGVSGLGAASSCIKGGLSTIIVDDQITMGGQYLWNPDLQPQICAKHLTTLQAAGATLLHNTPAIGVFPDESYPILCSSPQGPVRIKASVYIYATGTYPINMVFSGNDKPGVIHYTAALRLLQHKRIVPGKSMVLVGGAAGVSPRVSEDLSAHGQQHPYLQQLLPLLENFEIDVHTVPKEATQLAAKGHPAVTDFEYSLSGNRVSVPTELVVVCHAGSGATELPRIHGCQTRYSSGGFWVDVDKQQQTSITNVLACGRVCGPNNATKGQAGHTSPTVKTDNSGYRAGQTAIDILRNNHQQATGK